MIPSAFGTASTAYEVVSGHELTGKVVLITGGSAGIGSETARTLLSVGAEVVIAARDTIKGEEAVRTLLDEFPGGQAHFLPLNLGSLASVRQTAELFLARWSKLDVLINNAAIMATPLGYTVDGYEQQFGTNFLGHFLLTTLLLPALRSAAPSRVVSLTSGTHRLSDIHFEDINYQQRPYDKWQAYAQSKTADSLLAVALTHQFGEKGITANAVNPGGVLTGIQLTLTAEERRARYYDKDGNLLPSFKTPQQGAATTVWAAVAPELDGVGGLYLEDCQQAASYDAAVSTLAGYMPFALDADHAQQLWEVAEQIVGLTAAG